MGGRGGERETRWGEAGGGGGGVDGPEHKTTHLL